MKLNSQIIRLIALIGILIFSFVGCNKNIKKFNPGDIKGDRIYSPYFDKSIKPLKKEWNNLYYYLKRGHILQSVNNDDYDYIYSIELYKYLRRNLLKIYQTTYLQDYENFIKVFGHPGKIWERDGKINISYFQSVVGDSCTTCNHHGFGYVFDSKTKKLLKE